MLNARLYSGYSYLLLIEPHWIIIAQWDSKERHYQIFWPHGQNFWESSHIYCFYFLTFHSVFNQLHSGICLHQSIWNCFFNELWNIFYNLISHDLQHLTWWLTHSSSLSPLLFFLATFYLGFLLTSPSISHSLSFEDYQVLGFPRVPSYSLHTSSLLFSSTLFSSYYFKYHLQTLPVESIISFLDIVKRSKLTFPNIHWPVEKAGRTFLQRVWWE